MIERVLAARLRELAGQMPAVRVTGPRQSGKTTLCRAVFADRQYVSLERLDMRDFATADPRGFLQQYRDGAFLDEVQRAPSLFSYLQEELDRDPAPGRFILTGSQHFGLSEAITQSLAGRVALLHLLPPSLEELRRFPSAPVDLWSTLWAGAYPRIHDRQLDPNPVARGLRRHLRPARRASGPAGDGPGRLQHLPATDGWPHRAGGEPLDAGRRRRRVAPDRALLALCAGSELRGVPAAARWHRNLRKRAVKAAKLHLADSGLACHLLGIRSPDQLQVHPLRGAVFESWVAAEVLKARLHRGRPPDLFHLREDRRLELDVVAEGAAKVIGLEAKSGATIPADFFTHLLEFDARVAERHPHLAADLRLVYGGTESQTRHGVEALPWTHVQEVDW